MLINGIYLLSAIQKKYGVRERHQGSEKQNICTKCQNIFKKLNTTFFQTGSLLKCS